MLKELTLKDWKSFGQTTLYIDPLTLLIGTNASGKSNLIDALKFLNRIALGKDFESALEGDRTLPAIRGGVALAARKPMHEFTLEVLVQGEEENVDYLYSITLVTQETKPTVQLVGESLQQIEGNQKTFLFKAPIGSEYDFSSRETIVTSFNSKNGNTDNNNPRIQYRSQSILSQIRFESLVNLTKIEDFIGETEIRAIEIVSFLFQNIFILDPVPSQMRDYSPLSNQLESNASNLAGVLAALPEDSKSEIENTLSSYISCLPEGDIRRVWAEKVGRFGSDAMLYCEEVWAENKTTEIDARGMSDGTLRFLAILTALQTQPEGSQIVIEDIDNGLHPSRVKLLLQMLNEIGSKRKIDILATTHNPALLDALEPEMIPFVMVAHRDRKTGNSKITPLEDLNNLPKLLASASLGGLTEKGAIESSLARQEAEG